MKPIPVFFAAALSSLLLFLPALSARAHGPHEHGAARMDLAVEGAAVTIALESPLANFLPFERAPETEEQKAAARALAARLREGESLFRLSENAGCRLEKVVLESEPLEDVLREFSPESAARQGGSGESAEHGEEGEEHGDLDAEYSFRCDRPENLHSLEVLLFPLWPDLREIHAQTVTPAGQGAAELTPEQPLIRW